MQTVKTRELRAGMVTAAPVMIKQGLAVVKEGITLTSSLIARIAFYDVKQVAIEDYEMPKKPPEEADQEPTYVRRAANSSLFQKFQEDYARAVIELKNALSLVLSGHAPEIPYFHKILDILTAHAPTSLQMFEFLHILPATGDSIYSHALNVALISDMLGRWLNFQKEDIDALAAASLLHDIGKIKIPQEILDKPGRYTDEEFALVRKHPLFGYEFLETFEQTDPRIRKAAHACSPPPGL